MKNRITVFIPTYNRVNYLPILFESLKIQEYKLFEVLIIDDGSTDETKALIDEWNEKGNFKIRYIYQENSGKNVAYNRAIDEVETELFLEIDSDDYFLPNALSVVIEAWDNKSKENNIGAIQYLCQYEDGKIIGDRFTKEISDNYEIRRIDNIKGDKGMVYESSKLKQFRVPVIKGENVIYSILHNRVSTICKTLCINTPLVVKDYLDGGLTNINATQKKTRYQSLMIQYNELNYFKLSFGKSLLYNRKYIENAFLSNLRVKEIYNNAINKRMVLITMLYGFITYSFKKNKNTSR